MDLQFKDFYYTFSLLNEVISLIFASVIRSFISENSFKLIFCSKERTVESSTLECVAQAA